MPYGLELFNFFTNFQWSVFTQAFVKSEGNPENCGMLKNKQPFSGYLLLGDANLISGIFSVALLCAELFYFQVHVEAVSGISDDSQMGEGVWGVLKGRVVRYLLQGENILIGRNTKIHSVCCRTKI